MGNLTAVIISEDGQLTASAKKALKTTIPEKTGMHFQVKTHKTRERIGKLEQAQLTITDSFKPESPEYKLVRRLKDKGGSARILLTTLDKLKQEYQEDPKGSLIGRYKVANFKKTENGKPGFKIDEWFRENNPDYNEMVIQENGIFPEETFLKAVKKVRNEEKIKQSLNIGITALGKLGRAMCHDLKSKPYLKEAHVFSEFAKKDYEGLIIPRLAFEGDEIEKFTFHQSLKSLIESNPDFLIICTGEYGVPYSTYGEIKNLTERLMKGSYPKVKNTLQIIKDMSYKGEIFMEANPTGPHLRIGKRMGLDISLLSSITPDMSRHKTLLREKLVVKDPTLQYTDIDLVVIGEHGKEIPLLREARVRGELLTDAYPEFNKYDHRRAFIKEAREIGLKGMKVSEELGDNYGGTPDIIVKQIENFAHLKRTIPSAYSYFEPEGDQKEGCFIGTPSIIDYPLRIRSVATKLGDLSEDKEVMEELREQIAYQKALTDKYHPAD